MSAVALVLFNCSHCGFVGTKNWKGKECPACQAATAAVHKIIIPNVEVFENRVPYCDEDEVSA